MNAEYQRLEAEASEIEAQMRNLSTTINLRSPLDHAKFEKQIADLGRKLVSLRHGLALIRATNSLEMQKHEREFFCVSVVGERRRSDANGSLRPGVNRGCSSFMRSMMKAGWRTTFRPCSMALSDRVISSSLCCWRICGGLIWRKPLVSCSWPMELHGSGGESLDYSSHWG